MAFVWILTLIGTLASAFVIVATMAGAHSAPQEAAGYAMACALSIVPYVFARAGEAVIKASRKDATDRIVDAIEAAAQQSK